MLKRFSVGVIKAIVYGLVFIITMIVVSKIINKGTSDMTAQMATATFPTVSFILAGEHVNQLYGYAQTMDTALQRETILPVEADRKIQFQIDKFGQNISSVEYQIRSLDGKRLIENSKVSSLKETASQVFGEMILKDLIEAEKEYELVLIVTMEDGQDVHFYTRILPSASTHIMEKLQFIRDFHDKTFDKLAATELVGYLESNRKGDNTTLGYVNIHSSLDQVTWADCPVIPIGECIIGVKEIDDTTGSFQITYAAMRREGKQKKNYLIQENYRIRYTKERMYLLDFERSMEQIFDEKASVYVNNKIELGIQNGNVQLVEDDGGSMVAFVVGGSLYGFHTVQQKLSVLYSFWDDNNWDIRTYHKEHDIQILNVDEGGNVQFMVYGYHNRGLHEGHVGIAVYNYNAGVNTVEEILYVPYDKSYQILKQQLAQVNFLSNNNDFFFMINDTIYSANLDQLKLNVVTTNLKKNSFRISQNDTMLVWQEFEDEIPVALQMLNLTTMEENRIEAGYGNAIIPMGFMGADVVYGVANLNHYMIEPDGELVYLAHEVRIENEKRQLLKRFEPIDAYVSDCIIRDNQIVMSCVKILENGAIEDAPDEQIMSNESTKAPINQLEEVITEHYQKIQQIAFKNTFDTKTLKILTPKEVLFEGTREVSLGQKTEKPRYYVYHMGQVLEACEKSSTAVARAYENNGCVIAEDGSYIWRKTSRSSKNQIMAIKGGAVADENTSQLAICLDTVLEFKGVSRNTQSMLEQGMNVTEILDKLLLDYRILDLSGNKLEALLYYVNMDYPVLAVSKERNKAMLVIGFNDFNIVLMDPENGKLYKKGMNDSKAMFEDGSWQFITFLPRME